MNWLALVFALEVGWLPMGNFVLYRPEPIMPDLIEVTGSFYTALDTRAYLWNMLFIGGGVKTYIWSREGNTSFWPNAALYRLEAGVQWGILEIGWRHWCIHPVMPVLIAYKPTLNWEGAYEEIYFRIGGLDKPKGK